MTTFKKVDTITIVFVILFWKLTNIASIRQIKTWGLVMVQKIEHIGPYTKGLESERVNAQVLERVNQTILPSVKMN